MLNAITVKSTPSRSFTKAEVTDAIGVLEGVTGDIMKFPAGCDIASVQGVLCEHNEASASNHQEKTSLFSPGSSPQLERPEQNPQFYFPMFHRWICAGRFLHGTGISHVRASVLLWK